ncbi:hypothetical protein [Jonesia quinghaiensis]|uniref:hypothetical protein n=1 Tax=Jonesia quinghaiensis TaxID=262806 RepID=UPI000428C3F9|nr:hypothetical protein [Jonesia quinghaiensis]
MSSLSRNHTATARKNRRRKVLAIASGGSVLGIGLSFTLAAWTDTEWVFGANSAGDGPGIGTSTFEVQQSTESPFDTFVDAETAPGGAVSFSPNALALSPGVSTFAQVALRTTSDSAAGTLELQTALAATAAQVPGVDDTADALFNVLDVRVATSTDTQITCDATAFNASQPGVTTIADGSLSGAAATATQSLAAASGSVQFYCFEIRLADPFTPGAGLEVDDYMGRAVAPMWQFEATS